MPEGDLPSLVAQLAALLSLAVAALAQTRPDVSGRVPMGIEEAAVYLGVSKHWLYKHHGHLGLSHKIGGAVRFHPRDLDAYRVRQRSAADG